MNDPGYPEDIRKYDNDPRSPFYEDPYTDDQYSEYEEEVIQQRLEDSHYGDDWIEDINYKDDGHADFMQVVAGIRAGCTLSQEDINKSFMYFFNIANEYHQRAVENEDLSDELISNLNDTYESAKYDI